MKGIRMPEQGDWVSGPIDCDPETARYDAARLERLEAVFAALRAQGKIQCAAYALSRHGRVFANRCLGPRRYDGPEPMRSGDWRKIASITKVLTAIGILKLVEDGRLLMEWPLSRILPELEGGPHAGIRLFDVLTHTSGLPADPGYRCEPNPDSAVWKTMAEKDWVARLARTAPDHGIGAAWSYCSRGYNLLGEAIARVTGEPYYRWMEREVTGPLGMRDTFWDPGDRPLDAFAVMSADEAGMLAGRKQTLHHPSLAQGGAYSTCSDLLKLGRFFMPGGSLPGNEAGGRRVLGKAAIKAMRTIQVTVPAFHWGDRFPDWSYGLGLEPARHPLIAPGSVWGHEGSGRSSWWFAPEEGLAMAWLLPTALDWDPDFAWTPRTILLSGIA
jgi:CubicO group peptidase (beta-lactamase class C family)